MEEVVQILMENKVTTDKRSTEHSDFCKETDQKLREQERYTSEDLIITNNPPYNPRDYEQLIGKTIIIIKVYFNIELKGANYNACHLLPGNKQLSYSLIPAVTVKCVYFEETNQAYSQRKLLKEKKILSMEKHFNH